GGRATLSFTTSNSTPTGSYPITVTGICTSTHSPHPRLHVGWSSYVCSSNLASVTATQGGTSGTSSITAALTAGSSAQTVTLSAKIGRASCRKECRPRRMRSDGKNSSALTVTTSSSTPTGNYSVTVTGTGASS